MNVNKETINSRLLTVSAYHSQRRYNRYCCVPYVRLCGKWMEEFGFDIGEKVEVKFLSDKTLLIKKLPFTES